MLAFSESKLKFTIHNCVATKDSVYINTDRSCHTISEN